MTSAALVEAKSAVRRTLMRTGRKLTDKQLANLRSVLSYLEIGHSILPPPTGTPAKRVETDFDLFELALSRVRGARPLYLEFGVFEGRSLRWWSDHLLQPGARFVGFDSFKGLPEDWRPGLGTGHFATGSPPDLEDPRVSFQVGWFDETVPAFEPPEHDQLIINVDSDLYSSAVTVLTWAEPHLRPGTLLYFDEFPDRDHEMRAFTELTRRSKLTFVPLGFARGGIHWLFEVS
jgi:hypothetical protein